jgi:hypothetical protein
MLKIKLFESRREQRHNGSNTTHFIFSNSNIETLIKDVGNIMNNNI